MTEFAKEHELRESENVRRLHELERTGRYVFHGSPVSTITALEPRQPYDWADGTAREDGPPSVAATPYADIAIFRALVQDDHTAFGVSDDGSLHFEATPKALEGAHGKTGAVYVLAKEQFAPKLGNEQEMDWRAMKAQQPVHIISVTERDLPRTIKQI